MNLLEAKITKTSSLTNATKYRAATSFWEISSRVSKFHLGFWKYTFFGLIFGLTFSLKLSLRLKTVLSSITTLKKIL